MCGNSRFRIGVAQRTECINRGSFVGGRGELLPNLFDLGILQRVIPSLSQMGSQNLPIYSWESSKYEPTPIAWLETADGNTFQSRTSIESKECASRIDPLRETNLHIKFLSLEPLLSRLHNRDLHGIGLVIVGGESGPGEQAINPDWVREIRDHCQSQKVSMSRSSSSSGVESSKNAPAECSTVEPGKSFRNPKKPTRA